MHMNYTSVTINGNNGSSSEIMHHIGGRTN